jgi:site-specific DNA-methyltransferase (adenine-specific)
LIQSVRNRSKRPDQQKSVAPHSAIRRKQDQLGPQSALPKPAYRRPAPPPREAAPPTPQLPNSQTPQPFSPTPQLPTPNSQPDIIPHSHVVQSSAFTLNEDGTIAALAAPKSDAGGSGSEKISAKSAEITGLSPPNLILRDDSRGIFLYHGNCLELLDAIAAKYPEGRFDMIFADPPYFLSNGGITCHAGKMVKVDKGDWDKSRGPELNHEFNLEWLKRCQRVLKPNGTIWVSGTHHVIFSIGYAMQQLGYKILNDIAWEKPNPPPNLSCRYFTHSTETILWAAKNEKSKYMFNYAAMKAVTGKQMKTVWRMSAPPRAEKVFGKHPTQKPFALLERCLIAATNEEDTVFDPFLGAGTTAVGCARLRRQFIGIELDFAHATLANRRTDHEIVTLWLRGIRVEIQIETFFAKDLDPDTRSMDRIRWMKDGDPKTDCIYHETKFVFLSCAAVSSASVVHTTVDVSLQEAWASAPNGKKRETTHIVRCQTEILRVKSG